VEKAWVKTRGKKEKKGCASTLKGALEIKKDGPSDEISTGGGGGGVGWQGKKEEDTLRNN